MHAGACALKCRCLQVHVRITTTVTKITRITRITPAMTEAITTHAHLFKHIGPANTGRKVCCCSDPTHRMKVRVATHAA